MQLEIARSKVINVNNDKGQGEYQAMAFEVQWTEKPSTVRQFQVPLRV